MNILSIKNKTNKAIFFIVLFIVFVFSSKVSAEERITNFDSKIKINSDSSLLITETIKYDFGDVEKHGIFRDIPIVYKTSAGNKSINFDLQSVTVDGQKEDYQTSKIGSNKNIKIGKTGSLINGEHIYVIIYKIKGAISYFENLDELYWNVTGNEWQVPIENTTISIEIPDNKGGNFDMSCYLGVLGSNEKCTTEFKDNLYTARSIRMLKIGEGLTIAFDFPKGIVYKPTKVESILSFINDNIIVFLPFLIFIVMFFVWRKNGKDPKGYSTIIAQYEPPTGMKPTLVGSLVDEKPDYRDITAGLIYLAEQGFLKIKRIEKESIIDSIDYEIELINIDLTKLEKTEQNILKLFFGDNLIINSIKRISSLNKDVSFSIKVKKIISDLYQEMVDKKFYGQNPVKVKAVYMSIAIAFVAIGLFLFSKMIGLIGIISFIFSGIIIIIFGSLMGKKTKLGAETKDQILGFKLFLSVTEKDRLNFHNAPEKNPENFMEFLPYAIALKVENKWANQFEGVYIEQPSWYQSNMAGAFIATSFISHMSDFSKSVDTNMSFVSKGASNGGFGGGGSGFSGGGFGGGGGGSW